jgi:hypothetical protein
MLRQLVVKIIRAFLPKKCRQYLRTNFDFFDLQTHKIYTKQYGKIYTPIYRSNVKILNKEPDIYNADGTPIRSFFIRDEQFIDSDMQVSKYFMFDRYNFELPVHFYTHSCMRQTMGNPQKRYGLLVEPREITPYDYDMLDRHPEIMRQYDTVFTFDERLLNKYANTKPFCYNAVLRAFDNNIKLSLKFDFSFKNKTKNISIVSSNKLMCPLHKLRYDWAMKFKNNPSFGVDTFGTFDGGNFVSIFDYLTDYRYSIIVENAIEPYWFTEKILNCFATRTVPIYVGHAKMLERFNPDGIIMVRPEDYDNIEKIIKQCNEKDYASRMHAIQDNMQRVKSYQNSMDILYETYLKDDLLKD